MGDNGTFIQLVCCGCGLRVGVVSNDQSLILYVLMIVVCTLFIS